MSAFVTTDEVSDDVGEDNALWCLEQYLDLTYAELVPTGRWFRGVSWVWLVDMHRTGNKRCTVGSGCSTTKAAQTLNAESLYMCRK